MACGIRTAIAGVFVLFLQAGCSTWEKYGCDLAQSRGINDAKAAIEQSLSNEMSAASTIQDGRNWFRRHGIPLDGESKGDDRSLMLFGGFYSYDTQGFWASESLRVSLHFGADGHFVRFETSISQYCL